MNPIEALLTHNQEFAAQHFDPRSATMAGLKTVILGCADPRVDPVQVLGLKPEETIVIRNLGGRINPGFWQVMTMLQTVAQASSATPGVGGRLDLIVLHHTDCGITRLTDRHDMLANYFGIDTAEVDAKAVGDPWAAVQVDVALLRARALPPSWVISGLVYDVQTGLAEVIETTDPTR